MILKKDELISKVSGFKKYSTGSPAFDKLTGGGVMTGSVYHFFGEAGTGKTQLAMQVSLIFASLGKKVVYVDTEGKFRPERIVEIAENRKVSPSLENIVYVRAQNTQVQLSTIKEIMSKYNESSLVVVDSVSSNMLLDFPGEKNAFRRLSILATHISSICRDSFLNSRAYLLTNGVSFVSSDLPVGGRTVMDLLSFSIRLEKISSRYFAFLNDDVEEYRISKKGIE